MSAAPLYLLTTKNDASANPTHILTNGKMSVGSNSSELIDGSGIISTCSLNVGRNTNITGINTYGTYYSNNSSALLLPADISANRPTGQSGYIRYNTTLNVLEYWNPTSSSWTSIATPPILSSVNPSTVLSPIDLSLNGLNFQSGATVRFTDVSGIVYNSPSVTYFSSTLVVANSGTLPFTASGDYYDVTITNPDGLESTLQNYISTGISAPVFTTASGNIGRIYTGAYYDSSGSLTSYYNLLPVTATDPDGQPITGYSITSGSLPPGLSLNSSTGAITGNITLGTLSAPSASPSSTTYTFTVKADTSNASSSRSFNIIVYQPYLQTYSYTGGPQTFNVPSSLTTTTQQISARLWGAGGGNYYSGSYPNDINLGAPGGFTKTIFNVLESTYTLVVGGGGVGNAVAGYGGGGCGTNGGSGGGGGSYIFTGSIATPFQNVTYTGTFSPHVNNEPTTAVTSLAGASGVILVAGGGGGAGWYNVANGDVNQNGGPGGGITGGQSTNSRANRTLATGGTQTAGGVALSQGGSSTSPNYMTSASYLKGSGHTDNLSSGGSGGGGGGWYGGGGYQGGSGDNAGGGGGSCFAGYVNGSTSSTLTANTLNWSGSSTNSYIDSSTRTNGTRTYTNSQIYRKDNLVGAIAGTQTPPGNTDTYYSAGVGQSGPRASDANGGNGYIVLIY